MGADHCTPMLDTPSVTAAETSEGPSRRRQAGGDALYVQRHLLARQRPSGAGPSRDLPPRPESGPARGQTALFARQPPAGIPMNEYSS
jgi:hypothetical protein